MIIGNGLIAKSLQTYDSDHVIFIAAGVSNSKCSDQEEFEREKKLVREVVELHTEKKIVYFSSLSVLDPVMNQNPYVVNKRYLENFISQNCNLYTIVRISNLVGRGGNPNNIFNYLLDHVNNQKEFVLWKGSERNFVLDVHFAQILNYVLNQNNRQELVNIYHPHNYDVAELVTVIERFTGKTAKYKTQNIQSKLSNFSSEEALKYYNILNIQIDNYLENILHRILG
jgi:nucleoside-diphosphate-sugar epimerase